MNASRKKILVTGGAGFIGSHTVVELIHAGYEPVIIDNFSNSDEKVLKRLEMILNRRVKCYRIDCRDLALLKGILEKEGEVFGIIHFAAFKAVGESVQFPEKYYENNVGSMEAMLEIMEAANISNMVFSSSCTVYGEPDSLPVTEEAPIKEPTSPYGHTKQLCEEMLLKELEAKKINAVILRYFNPIGAHPTGYIGELPLGPPNNLVPYVTQTAARIREQLTIFGDDYNTPDGTCIRDFIHVVDLAKAHVRAINWLENHQTGGAHEIINIGTGKGVSVMEIVKTFIKIRKKKRFNYTIGPRREGDVEQIYANADKAKQVLDWEAKLTTEDALRDAWNWQKMLKKLS